MTKDRASYGSTSGDSDKRTVIFDLHSTYEEDSKELLGVAYWSDQVTTAGKIKAVRFMPDTDIPTNFSVVSADPKIARSGIGSFMGMAGEITLVLETPDDEEVKVTLSNFKQTFDDRSREGIRTVTIRSDVKVERVEEDDAWQTAEES